jgi:hypothetical protein
MVFIFSFKKLRFRKFTAILFRLLLLNRQEDIRVESLFLSGSDVVPLVMLIRTKHTCRLHGSSTFGAENASDLYAAFECQAAAVVADPIILWHHINSIAPLVHWDIAHTTEHDQIFVLIVTIIADCALCIFLHNEASLVS